MSRGGAHGGGGTRAFAPRMRAIGQAIPGQDIEPLCKKLIRSIRWIAHKTQEGAYILADSEGYVYVLRQQSCFTDRAVVQLSRMVVGLYAHSKSTSITPERLCSDLLQHFTQVGFIEIPQNRG